MKVSLVKKVIWKPFWLRFATLTVKLARILNHFNMQINKIAKYIRMHYMYSDGEVGMSSNLASFFNRIVSGHGQGNSW